MLPDVEPAPPPDPSALAALRRAYNDAVQTKSIYPRHSVRWCRAQNELTKALRDARELTGDPVFCFPVKA